jgi:hypothetical protein
MIKPTEESKEQMQKAAPSLMKLKNYTAILRKAHSNMDFSQVDFENKY